MFSRKRLDKREEIVLSKIQKIFGRRHHRHCDCYTTEDLQTGLFIKNKQGDALFSVNLTELSEYLSSMNERMLEKHLQNEFGNRGQRAA